MSREPVPTRPPEERILVCGVVFPDQPTEHDGALCEARGLVRAAGAVVLGEGEEPWVQRRRAPDPSTLFGRGKVDEIGQEIVRLAPDAVLVDNDLTPAQGRNLEKAWKKRVIDRSELILDIFATRARTRQAQLQVELAQTQYLRPRLRRMWTHLERTEGAIGTRGPGETQLETDRRLIDRRLADLRVRLHEIEDRKRRQVRARTEESFTVGLVGYTNAGKTTLLNRLTGADAFVADMPFATLDTRTRQWRLEDGRVVLVSDTVGFLQRLPHHLVASFHATLEEALNVDMLLHVVDAAHPDAETQMRAVEETLSGLTRREADLLVLNKVDLVADPIRLHLLRGSRQSEAVHVSAATGEGIGLLAEAVARRLDARSSVVTITLPLADGRSAAASRAAGVLLEQRVIEDRELVLSMRIAEHALGNLRRAIGDKGTIRVEQPATEPMSRG